MAAYKIIIRHCDEVMATICELPDRTTADEARTIFRKYFLDKMADDETIVELWRDEHEMVN